MIFSNRWQHQTRSNITCHGCLRSISLQWLSTPTDVSTIERADKNAKIKYIILNHDEYSMIMIIPFKTYTLNANNVILNWWCCFNTYIFTYHITNVKRDVLKCFGNGRIKKCPQKCHPSYLEYILYPTIVSLKNLLY